MSLTKVKYLTFQQQPDAYLNQDNPVSGQKYEVLATTKNVRILNISIKCTWTVQPTPLEIHLTIDGQPIIHSKVDPDSATSLFLMYKTYSIPTMQGLTITEAEMTRRAFQYEGRSVKVEAEITGGTVSNLNATVKWAKR